MKFLTTSLDLMSHHGTPSRRLYQEQSPPLSKAYSNVGPQSAYFNYQNQPGGQQAGHYMPPQEHGSPYPKSVPYMPMYSLMHPGTAEQSSVHAHDTTSMFNANPLPNLQQLSATLDPALFQSGLPPTYQGQGQGDHIRASMDERFGYQEVRSAQPEINHGGYLAGGVKGSRRPPPRNMGGKLKTERRHTDNHLPVGHQLEDNYFRGGGYATAFDPSHNQGDSSFSAYLGRSSDPPYPSDNMYPVAAQQFVGAPMGGGYDSPMRRAGAEQIMNSPGKHMGYQMGDARSSSVQPYPYQAPHKMHDAEEHHQTYSYHPTPQRSSQPPQKKYYELGGLGPNVGSEDWMKAKQRSEIASQYSRNIKVYNKQSIRTNSRGNGGGAPKAREPTARERALEFAKNIKKPLPASRGMNTSQKSFQSGGHESEVLMGKMEELEARHSEL